MVEHKAYNEVMPPFVGVHRRSIEVEIFVSLVSHQPDDRYRTVCEEEDKGQGIYVSNKHRGYYYGAEFGMAV